MSTIKLAMFQRYNNSSTLMKPTSVKTKINLKDRLNFAKVQAICKLQHCAQLEA